MTHLRRRKSHRDAYITARLNFKVSSILVVTRHYTLFSEKFQRRGRASQKCSPATLPSQNGRNFR